MTITDKEFWGRIGFKFGIYLHPDVNYPWEGWHCPDNIFVLRLPPIDLNNLFKYAVPIVFEKYGRDKLRQLLEVWAIYVSSGAYFGYEAKALKKAICEVIGEEKPTT